MRNSKLFQVGDPRLRVLPLFPDKTSESVQYTYLKPFEKGFGFCQTVVSPPAKEVLVQFGYDLSKASATAAVLG